MVGWGWSLISRLLELKRQKINSFKIIIGLFFTPPLFSATKVAISFVYYSPKTTKCTQNRKKVTGIKRASERVPFSRHIYNSLLRMCTIHELKRALWNYRTEIFLPVQKTSEIQSVFAFNDFIVYVCDYLLIKILFVDFRRRSRQLKLSRKISWRAFRAW